MVSYFVTRTSTADDGLPMGHFKLVNKLDLCACTYLIWEVHIHVLYVYYVYLESCISDTVFECATQPGW